MGDIQDHEIVHCKCHATSHIIAAGMVAPHVKNSAIAYLHYSRDEELNFIPTLFIIIFLLLCMLFMGLAFFKDKKNVLKVCDILPLIKVWCKYNNYNNIINVPSGYKFCNYSCGRNSKNNQKNYIIKCTLSNLISWWHIIFVYTSL